MKNAMKFLTAILCAVLTLGFIACQRDYEDLIIGSWEVVDITHIVDDGTNVDTRTETLGEGVQMVFTFNKDLSCEISETWTSEGHPVTTGAQGTYSISDDLLTIVITESDTFTIKTLEKNNLVLSMSRSHETEGGTITSTREYNFKRA